MIKPHFVFEITTDCNLNCIYCYNVWKQDSFYNKSLKNTDELKYLFKKLKDETDFEAITLAGGEPLLFENLIEFTSFLKTLNIKIGVASNGVLLTDEKISALINAGVGFFEISVDSLNADINRKLTGFDILPEVKKTILNIKKHRAGLNISTIISKLNLASIADIIDLAFAFSADSISLNRFVPGGRGLSFVEELKPDKKDLVEILGIAQQKASKISTKVIFTIPIEDCEFDQSKYPDIKFGTCMCGQIKWTIDSVGNLRTCEQNPEILGNLFSNSFKDLSENISVNKFITNNLKENCNQCTFFFKCGGGCRFLRY